MGEEHRQKRVVPGVGEKFLVKRIESWSMRRPGIPVRLGC